MKRYQIKFQLLFAEVQSGQLTMQLQHSVDSGHLIESTAVLKSVPKSARHHNEGFHKRLLMTSAAMGIRFMKLGTIHPTQLRVTVVFVVSKTCYSFIFFYAPPDALILLLLCQVTFLNFPSLIYFPSIPSVYNLSISNTVCVNTVARLHIDTLKLRM